MRYLIVITIMLHVLSMSINADGLNSGENLYDRKRIKNQSRNGVI